MTLTISIDPSWIDHPRPLRRILDQLRALEVPAPWTPPPAGRQPGDDDGDDDDLGELLDGIDAPEPVQAPPPAVGRINPPAHATAPPPAAESIPSRASTARPQPAPPAASLPTSGRGLYRWACDRKCLPELNRIGKQHGFPRLVSNWTPSDVAIVLDELLKAAQPAPSRNGRSH